VVSKSTREATGDSITQVGRGSDAVKHAAPANANARGTLAKRRNVASSAGVCSSGVLGGGKAVVALAMSNMRPTRGSVLMARVQCDWMGDGQVSSSIWHCSADRRLAYEPELGINAILNGARWTYGKAKPTQATLNGRNEQSACASE
jgi:hypothetical protein